MENKELQEDTIDLGRLEQVTVKHKKGSRQHHPWAGREF